MTRKEKQSIRARDKYHYCKEHGPIPEGMTMHHNYYNELWYDEGSFIIITKEEHEWIHGRKIDSSEGHDHSKSCYTKEEIREKNKKYHEEHKEVLNAKSRKYYEEHKEELKAKSRERDRKYREEHKEEYNAHRRELYRKRKLLKG